MKIPALFILIATGGLAASAGSATPALPATLSSEAMRRHIATLASDDFEGRAPGSRGEELTTAYLVGQLKQLGAEPADAAATFLQEVPLVGIRSTVTAAFTAAGKAVALDSGRDYFTRSYDQRPESKVDNADVMFAGYGIVAPEFGWDDYKAADMRGKVVILLEGEPTVAESKPGHPVDAAFFQGEGLSYYGTTSYKYEQARKKGAAAVFILHTPRSASALTVMGNNYRQESFDLKFDPASVPPCVVQGRITREAFGRLGQAGGQDVAALLQRAERKDFAVAGLGVTAAFTVRNELRSVTSHNVVAKVTGTDPNRRAEVIVYTAHWDHLGRDDSLPGDKIYNGAIDNAAGVAELLGIIELFTRAAERPGRTVMFLFTTAEEKGYLGARYYVRHPLFPLTGTLANINLDAGNVWGRTADTTNLGYGLTTLDDGLAASAAAQQRTFVRDALDGGSYFFASDQIEFAKAGVPAVFPGAGESYRGRPAAYGGQKWAEYGEKYYHQVGDEIQADWDFSGMIEDAEWLWRFGQELSLTDTWPQWKPGAGFSRPATNDEQQLIALEEEWVRAEGAHDKAALQRILDEQFVCTFGGGKLLNKQAFIESVTEGPLDPTLTQTLSDRTVVINGDTAILVVTDTVRRTKDGQPRENVYRFTTTYIRRNGRWLALAEQSAKVNPMR